MSLDKDGVRTAAIFYEMADQWSRKGISLVTRLDQLYQKYGYYTMSTSYFVSDSPAKTTNIFNKLRGLSAGAGAGATCRYADSVGEYKISSVRDVTLGTDSKEASGKSALPCTPDAQMITYRFANGATSTLRASGTEPKIKYYVECNDPDPVASRVLTDRMTEAIIRELLQPKENGLTS